MKYIKKVGETPLSRIAKVIDSLSNANNRTNAPSIRAVNEGINNTWSKVYPIGSIYMNVNNIDPSVIFGGTWERVTRKYLIGADSEDFIAGTTGGSFNTEYTPQGTVEGHALTINEMPSHSHTYVRYNTILDVNEAAAQPASSHLHNSTSTENTGNAGGGAAHSHNFSGTQATIDFTPPYLAVYIWVRTA